MSSIRHTITLDNREKLKITGITDILSYDEETIVAQTENGILVVKGENLHITNLNLDEGLLSADGSISAIDYDNPSASGGGFFGRIFK
ncbi:MAG: sporulation protein YabP [Clostridia bacterium]|nr:sporulation protein YabP [Clostridia bacterium]